ncbi:MAG: FKBP-type peptidyl-prolyl cis-trans isomerase N-terminal domain-containing protein [Myxococcota bacterium]
MTFSLRALRTERRSGRSLQPIVSIALALLALGLVGSASQAAAQTAPKSDDEKAFYSIGTGMANQLQMLKPLSDRELDLLVQGVRDAVRGRTLAVEQQEGATLVRALVKQRQEKAIELERAEAAAFLAAEAAKKGARTTESGLVYTEVRAGNGASPTATDKVRVHYHGTLRDGTVFDSSIERGQPRSSAQPRDSCWTEGVAMMKVGGKSRLVSRRRSVQGTGRRARSRPGPRSPSTSSCSRS